MTLPVLVERNVRERSTISFRLRSSTLQKGRLLYWLEVDSAKGEILTVYSKTCLLFFLFLVKGRFRCIAESE